MRLLVVAALLACAAGCARPPSTRSPARPERRVPAAEPDGGHAELDVVGVVHVVRKGETLYRIARAYSLSPQDLADVNGIRDPRALEIGDELFVPGATRTVEVPPPPAGAAPEPVAAQGAPAERGDRPGRLAWPLKGVLYSKFGPRQGQHHDGIDISAPEGTIVGAAAAGRVVYAGQQAGYGSLVILRHAGGLITVYAHASELLVRDGEEVGEGAPIARVGQSGRTTGPHLHFEVREGTRPADPLRWLRGG